MIFFCQFYFICGVRNHGRPNNKGYAPCAFNCKTTAEIRNICPTIVTWAITSAITIFTADHPIYGDLLARYMGRLENTSSVRPTGLIRNHHIGHLCNHHTYCRLFLIGLGRTLIAMVSFLSAIVVIHLMCITSFRFCHVTRLKIRYFSVGLLYSSLL